jgi:hypothetical protein
MPVVMIMKWEGVTKEQYEAVRKEANWEGNRPKGGNFHVAAFSPAGLHVTDLWDSAGDFQQFVETRLMPAVAKVGVQGQPETQIHPVHAIYSPAYEPA